MLLNTHYKLLRQCVVWGGGNLTSTCCYYIAQPPPRPPLLLQHSRNTEIMQSIGIPLRRRSVNPSKRRQPCTFFKPRHYNDNGTGRGPWWPPHLFESQWCQRPANCHTGTVGDWKKNMHLLRNQLNMNEMSLKLDSARINVAFWNKTRKIVLHKLVEIIPTN